MRQRFPGPDTDGERFLLHHGLERTAELRPDATAVVFAAERLSYAELDARASKLAGLLVELGVQPGDRVGLYLDKSIEAVVALYAVLKAGGAYVPLDAGSPVSRLVFVASNCGIRCLVSSRRRAEGWAGLAAGSGVGTIVVLDADPGDVAAMGGVEVVGADSLAAAPELRVHPGTVSLDLAYILYTSGSTGTPKGVMLTHANALAFVGWAVRTFGVSGEDRVSSHAPFHFDLSVFDLFASSAAGAAMVLVPPEVSVFPSEVARFIDESKLTFWYSVPSVLSMLALRGGLAAGAFPALRTVLFAGEVFPTKYLRTLMELLPHVRFANLYGPTETNVCTWFDVAPLPPDRTEPVPIGRAIDDTDAFAVTEDGRRAAPGEVGELYVRGSTVMQGYWGDAERTSRALVSDPAGRVHGVAYRTGDLVREDANGDLEFLGRRDSQVKSRGYRIELGDIETALDAAPEVIECAVVAVPDDVFTNRIHAFVVADVGVTATDLRSICAARLPRYMLPESIEVLASLPKTSTGKVDRQALLGQDRPATAR